MTTPLGTLGLSFAIFLFIVKQYLAYCFFSFSPCCGYVVFIKFYFFTLFTVLACIVIHFYHGYLLDMDRRLSHITHLIFNTCGINFKISGGVTAPQWL
jgi:hypothetical protein